VGCVTLDPVSTNLDVTVLDRAVALLGCLEDQLTITVGGPVCRSCIYPGQAVPMDVCQMDEGCGSGGHGMAAVRVVAINLVPEQVGTSCLFSVSQLAVTYEMTAYRCAHTIQRDQGRAVALPSCDELASDTAIILDDAAAMRRALKCCFATPPPEGGCSPRISAVLPWQPRGPIGGCVGGTMQFTVTLNDCSCAEAEAQES